MTIVNDDSVSDVSHNVLDWTKKRNLKTSVQVDVISFGPEQ